MSPHGSTGHYILEIGSSNRSEPADSVIISHPPSDLTAVVRVAAVGDLPEFCLET